MHELASMAANKAQERNAQHNEPSSNINLKVIFIDFNMKTGLKCKNLLIIYYIFVLIKKNTYYFYK